MNWRRSDNLSKSLSYFYFFRCAPFLLQHAIGAPLRPRRVNHGGIGNGVRGLMHSVQQRAPNQWLSPRYDAVADPPWAGPLRASLSSALSAENPEIAFPEDLYGKRVARRRLLFP